MSTDEEFRKWLAKAPSSDYDYPGVTRETQLIGFAGHLLQELTSCQTSIRYLTTENARLASIVSESLQMARIDRLEREVARLQAACERWARRTMEARGLTEEVKE